MEHNQAMLLAHEVLKLGGAPPKAFGPWAPSAFFNDCAYAAKQIPEKLRPPWLIEWAKVWSEIRGDYERLRRRDPMMAYRPANPTMEAFHRSLAHIRQARTGNRCGKTQAGYAEDYWSVTGSHPYRPMDPWPASVLIICGLPFSDYVSRTFEKKMIYGEDGPGGQNPLSPVFPEGGKWFYAYNKKDHIVTLGCPECAEAGRAGRCPGHHKKTTIALATIEKKVTTIESFSVRVVHADEHITDEFFSAATQRVGDQNGYLIVTATPLHGPQTWEEEKLTKIANGDATLNLKNPDNPDSVPYTSLHTCNKYEGGIVPHEAIKADERTLNPFQKAARIDGIPVALATNWVFNPEILAKIQERDVFKAVRGTLVESTPLVDLLAPDEMDFIESAEGSLRIWEQPVEHAQYVMGVDTAAGLSQRDPSCATVLRLSQHNGKVIFKVVAQYHGWLPVLEYADEVFKLGVFYNSALVVVELTGGLGRAVVERLKQELCYWNLFRDVSKGESAEFNQGVRYGIDTSMNTKPSMIGLLQQTITGGRLWCPCKDTIAEMLAYEQTRTELGNSRYGGKGMHDDRVMALVIAVATAISNNVYDATEALRQLDTTMQEKRGFWAEVDSEMVRTQEEQSWS